MYIPREYTYISMCIQVNMFFYENKNLAESLTWFSSFVGNSAILGKIARRMESRKEVESRVAG